MNCGSLFLKKQDLTYQNFNGHSSWLREKNSRSCKNNWTVLNWYNMFNHTTFWTLYFWTKSYYLSWDLCSWNRIEICGEINQKNTLPCSTINFRLASLQQREKNIQSSPFTDTVPKAFLKSLMPVGCNKNKAHGIAESFWESKLSQSLNNPLSVTYQLMID